MGRSHITIRPFNFIGPTYVTPPASETAPRLDRIERPPQRLSERSTASDHYRFARYQHQTLQRNKLTFKGRLLPVRFDGIQSTSGSFTTSPGPHLPHPSDLKCTATPGYTREPHRLQPYYKTPDQFLSDNNLVPTSDLGTPEHLRHLLRHWEPNSRQPHLLASPHSTSTCTQDEDIHLPRSSSPKIPCFSTPLQTRLP